MEEGKWLHNAKINPVHEAIFDRAAPGTLPIEGCECPHCLVSDTTRNLSIGEPRQVNRGNEDTWDANYLKSLGYRGIYDGDPIPYVPFTATTPAAGMTITKGADSDSLAFIGPAPSESICEYCRGVIIRSEFIVDMGTHFKARLHLACAPCLLAKICERPYDDVETVICEALSHTAEPPRESPQVRTLEERVELIEVGMRQHLQRLSALEGVNGMINIETLTDISVSGERIIDSLHSMHKAVLSVFEFASHKIDYSEVREALRDLDTMMGDLP